MYYSFLSLWLSLLYNTIKLHVIAPNKYTNVISPLKALSNISLILTGKYGLMFYNAAFMSLPAVVALWYTEDDLSEILTFQGWGDPVFCFKFLLSCVFGFILVKNMYQSPIISNCIGFGTDFFINDLDFKLISKPSISSDFFFQIFTQVLCTQHNSALTTNVVGCIKNILTMYVGK